MEFRGFQIDFISYLPRTIGEIENCNYGIAAKQIAAY